MGLFLLQIFQLYIILQYVGVHFHLKRSICEATESQAEYKELIV